MEYQSDEDFTADHQSHNPKKIFVGNLPFTITSNELQSLFSKFGKVIGINIREDRVTRKPKGFAFVTFESEESTRDAIQQMNHYNYDNRMLSVNRAVLRGTESNQSVEKAWKTIPTPKSSKKTNDTVSKKSNSKNSTTSKPQKTWDHWAGPTVYYNNN
eukprot:gene7384-10058_t